MLTKRFRFIEPGRPFREMRILGEIARRADVSQRSLAASALLGPTMVNRYVAEMQQEGLIEAEGETNRSFRYRLTPAGRYRHDELVFHASKEIVQFYGLVKQEFHRRLARFAAEGARRVILFGAAETGEIVHAASEGSGVEIVGVVDNDRAKHGRRFGALRVAGPEIIRELRPDAVLITSFGHADEIQEQVRDLEHEGIRVARI